MGLAHWVGWLVFLMSLVSVVLMVMLRRRRRSVLSPRQAQDQWPWRQFGLPMPLPEETRARAAVLLDEGRSADAAQTIHEDTGLGLEQAERHVANMLAAARIRANDNLWPDDQLADRVSELVAAGRSEQAILLIRGETGMSHADSENLMNELKARYVGQEAEGLDPAT